MKRTAWLVGLVLLPLLPVACGEPANPEKAPNPTPDQQRLVSAPGPTKSSEATPPAPVITAGSAGAAAQPKPAGHATSDEPTKSTEFAKPAEPAKAKPPEPAKPGPPATLDEVVAAIDLRKLPKLEGARIQTDKAAWVNYTAPGQLAESAELYRNKLTELGWTEDNTPIPGIDPKQYFFAGFDKAGFRVSVSISKSDKEGRLNVDLNNGGNVDPRQFARPADAKPTHFYRHYVAYTTATKPQEAIEFCRKDIVAQGWREYRVSNAKFHAKQGRFLLGFINNGMGLLLNISSDKDGRTVVERHAQVRDKQPVRAAAKDLPKPATLSEGRKVIDLHRFPRLEGAAPGQGTSAVLQYDAPGSVADAVSFYRKKLGEQGWKEEPSRYESDDSASSHFVKAGFFLECNIRKAGKAGRVTISIQNKGNVDVRQLPRVQEAEDASAGSFGLDRYDTDATVDEAAVFYRNELTKLGWKEIKGGDGSRDYPEGRGKRLVFQQNSCKVEFEIRPDGDGDIDVLIVSQMYGAFVAQPGRPEAALHVIDLRKLGRIEGAPASSATSSSVSYAASGSVADAAKFYRRELEKREWRGEQRPTPLENDDRAKLRFGKDGFIVVMSLLSGEPRGVSVTVNNRGDLNTRELLHLEDAREHPDSEREHTIYTTAATVDAAIDFYRKEWPKFGWQLSKGPATIPSHIELEFTQKAIRLVVGVTTNDQRKTEVQVQSFVIGDSAAVAAVPSKVEPSPKPKSPAPSKPKIKLPDDGTRPTDLPIPADAEEVEFNTLAKIVRFKSPSSIRTLVDYYRKEMKAKGWTEDQKKKILVMQEVGVTNFKKARASLAFTMRRADDSTAVTIICKGVEFR